jgi:hypothetical protein
MTEALNIERLHIDSIDSKPVQMDWSSGTYGGYDEDSDKTSWDYTEAVECEECGRIIVGSGYIICDASDNPDDGDTATCSHCETPITFDGFDWSHDEPIFDEDRNLCTNTMGEEGVAEPKPCGHETLAEGPMMNYWYPVKIQDAADAARELINLPLCVVEVDGETGLALTGGGMDLSWEICEAFILLGHQPPLHFCDLPRQYEVNDRRRSIINAAMKSAVIAARQANYVAERLAERYEMPIWKDED